MIRHHCHSWFGGGRGGWSGGVEVGNGGVSSAGASNILASGGYWMKGCNWMGGGFWTTTAAATPIVAFELAEDFAITWNQDC